MAGPKFWTSTVLLAFISLSGASELRRCYWCGPLAEQVHRSRRSGACSGTDPVTTCEEGFNYCAVVATAPPRIESRLCVKVYQDECYPVYCNSTKTWKMTCPCRGDLCNGPKTEREIEAFALLPKLVAKTHSARIKKRTANAAPYIMKERNMIDNTDNSEKAPQKLIVNESENSSQQADQANIIVEKQEVDITSLDNEVTTSKKQLIEIEIHVSDPTIASDKNNEGKPCTDSTTPREDVTETVKQEEILVITTVNKVESNEASTKTDSNMAQSQEPMTTEATTRIQDVVVVTEKPPEPSMKPTELTQKEETTKAVAQDEMQNDAPIINPTDTQPIQTTQEVKVDVMTTKNSVKPSDPTAQALQENSSSAPVTEATKATQASTETTTVTTISTTGIMAKITTTPASRRKNSAAQLTYNFAILLSCIINL